MVNALIRACRTRHHSNHTRAQRRQSEERPHSSGSPHYDLACKAITQRRRSRDISRWRVDQWTAGNQRPTSKARRRQRFVRYRERTYIATLIPSHQRLRRVRRRKRI